MLTITTTFRRDWSSWDDFLSGSIHTTLVISSFRSPGRSCFQKRYSFVVVLLTIKKNGLLCKSSIMSFSGSHYWLTRLKAGTKCRSTFDLVVTVIFVTDRASSNFFLLNQTVLECFVVDPLSSLDKKCGFMIAPCVSCFIKTAFADTACCFTMATVVDLRTVTFYSSGRIASMWS